MNNRDKVVVFGMGDLEDWVGSCLPFTTGVTRSISLGGGEKGFCPAKLSCTLQTSKQSYVYRMLMKALPMYIILYQG